MYIIILFWVIDAVELATNEKNGQEELMEKELLLVQRNNNRDNETPIDAPIRFNLVCILYLYLIGKQIIISKNFRVSFLIKDFSFSLAR